MRSPLKKLRSTSAFILPLTSISSALASSAEGLIQPSIEYMNADIIQLIAYVLLALGFSFLCSVAEAVLLSVTPSYIEGLKEKRPKRAALLKLLKQGQSGPGACSHFDFEHYCAYSRGHWSRS